MKQLRQPGFTIIEMMVVIAILAILVALAAPAMSDFIEKRRLIGAAEELYSQLQFARSEAIKQSTNMRVNVNGGAWCLGITDAAADCDCTAAAGAADACSITMDNTAVLKVVAGSTFPGTALATTQANFVFDGVRGTVLAGGGTLTLTSPKGWELRVITSTLGRVRMCSPSGDNFVGGYPACN